jgi:hypothetical protein
MKNKLGTIENMVEYHENGKLSYEFMTNPIGLIEEKTFDKNGNILTVKYSKGYSCEYTRDENGNELAFRDSNGQYIIKDKQVTQEEYEAFIQELEKPKKQTAVEWLADQFKKQGFLNDLDIEAALVIQQKQIQNAYSIGKIEAKMPNEVNTTGAEYYNQNYNQK